MTQFSIEIDREEDGRWIAEIPALPGALCYGVSKDEATRKVEALALRILADRVESGEDVPEVAGLSLWLREFLAVQQSQKGIQSPRQDWLETDSTNGVSSHFGPGGLA